MKFTTTFLLACIAAVQAADAALLQYEFSARVTVDAGSPLVQPNDVLHGTFAYDVDPTSAIQFPTDPTAFTWDRPAAPIGIRLDVNGTLLAQEPDNFAQIRVINDDFSLGDQFEFVSFIGPRTVEDPFEYAGPIIGLVLADTTGSAFASADLPSALSFDEFTSGELVVYDGTNPYFQAEITSLVPVPEPSATLVLSMALPLLLYRRRIGSRRRAATC